jgi:ADP-ribosylglycohydrolase
MNYPEFGEIHTLLNQITEFSRLKAEYGSTLLAQEKIDTIQRQLKDALDEILKIPDNIELLQKEPSLLDEIKKLRKDGPHRIWDKIEDDKQFKERMEGAVYGRFIGCTLGVPVEGWDIEEMKNQAADLKMPFPPANYWKAVTYPYRTQYNGSFRSAYSLNGINGIPVDDDITYTLVGLLILEKYGLNFTTNDVGEFWKEYLPIACTAEDIALRNLKNGIPADKAAEIGNPYAQWIGADIRSDAWGYACAGYPEKAAELAYKDAYLSHRRNGIYGEMFFSAVIAAAFTVDNAIDALKIGLTEIPSDCLLYHDIIWALDTGKHLTNYQDARDAVNEHFKGMPVFHTNNNACLTIFGLMIGGNDFTKVISQTMAMGLDNDCTTATAGSIIGAIVGIKGISEYWYKNFYNKVYSYLNNYPEFALSDVVERFVKLAQLTHQQ